MLRLPEFVDNWQIKVASLSTYAQAAFTSQKIFLVLMFVGG
jgi:hypothetical protein